MRLSSLIQQSLDPQDRAEPLGGDERGGAHGQAPGGTVGHRQQLEVAPDPGRPRCDRRPGEPRADEVQVVGDLERAEAAGADVARAERLRPTAVATAQTDDPGVAAVIHLESGPDRSGHLVAGAGGRARRSGQQLGGHRRSSILVRPRLAERGGGLGFSARDREREDPSWRKGLGELPYLAGGPARIWHLADSTSIGCRGFIGPVPPPLLISALQLSAHRRGAGAGASSAWRQATRGRRSAVGRADGRTAVSGGRSGRDGWRPRPPRPARRRRASRGCCRRGRRRSSG